MLEVKNRVQEGDNADAIYLHIPFCNKKCDYCDFCTFINMEKEYEKYVKALVDEINLYPDYKYDTVYLGGGTPSLLPARYISQLMEHIRYDGKAEITLELNPENMTLEKLSQLRNIGINRLSIGVQSFQEHILKFLGRGHTGAEAERVFLEARKAGFENISIDIMFGIPGQTLDDLKRDLKKAAALSPENISIYSLIWEEGTVFFHKLQKGILNEIDQDIEAEMFELIIDFLEKNGYVHYEISNFSKKGYAGRHNLKYWKNREFIGIGLSAASYYRGKRYHNTRIFSRYYKSIGEKRLPVDEKTVEVIDEKEAVKLGNMLGLRLVREGIEYFEDEKISKLINEGLIEKILTDGKYRIRLTRRGILLANNVFVEFI